MCSDNSALCAAYEAVERDIASARLIAMYKREWTVRHRVNVACVLVVTRGKRSIDKPNSRSNPDDEKLLAFVISYKSTQ